MSTVFVDTAYLLALEIGKDAHHSVALEHWQSVSRSLPSLITTSYVFDEVTTFLNSRDYHNKAVEIGNYLLHSASMRLVHVDESLFYEAWTLFQSRIDKRYSLTDCVSFEVMRRYQITTAYAFDKHFQQEGFLRELS